MLEKKVLTFDEANHTTKTSFLHGILKYQYQQRGEALPDWLPAYELNELKVSCLFGEHLLSKYPSNPVALVEAPKGAIYGTLYFGLPNVPERFLWLAVYNLSSLNVVKCKALEGRQVVLFPDLSKDGKAFELWNSKLKELNTIKGARFTISGLLESKASEAERLNGCDIADYLITKDWRLFRESEKSEKSESGNKDILLQQQTDITQDKQSIAEPIEPETSEPIEKIDEVKPVVVTQPLVKQQHEPQPDERWSAQILEIETYFATAELPADPIPLNDYTKISDINTYIEYHLRRAKANNNVSGCSYHLETLLSLKQTIVETTQHGHPAPEAG